MVEGLRLTDDAKLAYLRNKISTKINYNVESYPLEPTGINPTIREYASNLKVGGMFLFRKIQV